MSEELRDLGIQIKAKRKELKLTLKEVENGTSIRTSYLEAIEEGRIQECIAGVYAMGFMKQYASFVGIDMSQMTLSHPHLSKLPSEKHDFSYGIGTLEVRGSAGGGVKWLPNLIWAAVVAVVLVVAWYLAKFAGVL